MGRSLAAAAHDMKTPLIAIGSCARRLIKKSYSDQEKDKLALQGSQRSLVEKMLSWSIGVAQRSYTYR
jgi:K+-sensing histidine kinase KdpD